MASEFFTIKIFTPTGLVREDMTNSVILPSSNGEIGILPEHCRYTGVIGTGILEYTAKVDNQKVRLVISEGFCSFSMDTLVILADEVFLATDSRKVELVAQRSAFEKVLSEGSAESMEWQLAIRSLEKIEALSHL